MSGALSLTRRPRTSWGVVVAALAAASSAQAKDAGGNNRNLPLASSKCEVVQCGGDVGSCKEGPCVLSGDAFLACDDLKVWAQHIEVRFTEEREFAGAVAKG